MEPGTTPPHAASFADERLCFVGIAAVPDTAGALRTAGPRSAWSLAKQARARAWDACTVVRIDRDPAALVPALATAAATAGYQWVVTPWAPIEGAPAETVNRLYHQLL
ncbi:MAG: hypothetical protein ACRD0U_04555 [Acidimicrobiales bacterium]